MGMLAFFPWYTTPEPVRLGRFCLERYERGRGAHADAAIIDSVLRAYVEPGEGPGGRPVDSATLLRLADRPVTAELDAQDRAAAFQLAEIVAFAALSRREFLAYSPYVNRDDFRLIIQRFSAAGPTGVSIISRQRNGPRMAGYGPGTFVSMRPPHTNSPSHFRVDVALASALLAVSDTELWPRYEDGVFSFNAANTDRDDVPDQHEVVAMVGAFQRILKAKGKADDVAKRLNDLLTPYLAPDPSSRRLAAALRVEAKRRATEPGYTAPRSMTEAWFRDFFFVRNAFGHGQRRENRSRWSSSEHLMFGAYIFPFVMAASLEADGFYKVTDAERKRAWGFPYYLMLRHPLALRRYLGAEPRSAWRMAEKKVQDAQRHQSLLRALEVLERAEKGTAAGSSRDPRG